MLVANTDTWFLPSIDIVCTFSDTTLKLGLINYSKVIVVLELWWIILVKIYLIFQTKTAFRLNNNICSLKQSAWRYYSRVLRLIRLLICRLPSLRPSGENWHFLRHSLSIERCMEDGKTPSVVFSRFSGQRRFRGCPATILTNCAVLFPQKCCSKADFLIRTITLW